MLRVLLSTVNARTVAVDGTKQNRTDVANIKRTYSRARFIETVVELTAPICTRGDNKRRRRFGRNRLPALIDRHPSVFARLVLLHRLRGRGARFAAKSNVARVFGHERAGLLQIVPGLSVRNTPVDFTVGTIAVPLFIIRVVRSYLLFARHSPGCRFRPRICRGIYVTTARVSYTFRQTVSLKFVRVIYYPRRLRSFSPARRRHPSMSRAAYAAEIIIIIFTRRVVDISRAYT